MAVKRLLTFLLVAGLVGPTYAQGAATVTRGDYTASLTDKGLVVSLKGTNVTCGSRLAINKPGWTGAYYSTRAFDTKTAKVTATEKQLTITDTVPELDGRLTYTAEVDPEGVTVTLTVRIEREVEPCPMEFTAAMFDPERFAGGELQVTSLLGEGDRAPLPAEKPTVTGPGTFLVRGDLLGIALRGKGLEVRADPVGARPSLYDMRSRTYAPDERVYWLLYQSTLSRGEATFTTRLSARLLAAGPTPATPRGEVLLVEGKRRTPIDVICLEPNAHPVEKAAARELQAYLKKMGAGEVEIIEVGRTPVPREGTLYVGQSDPATKVKLYAPGDFDGLGSDGYLVRARGGNVLAAGGGYRGTVYAVYRLLDHLGCRFYANELEVVPEGGRVEIRGPLNLKSAPAFEWRAMWGTIAPMKAGLSPGEWPADVAEVALPKMMGIPKGGFWHHTMGFLLPAKDLPAECLAMIGGKREVREPAVQQYCLSNPELHRRMTEVTLRWMDEDPNPLYYPIHYGDVGNFCECEGCKALYAEKGSVSDAVIWFLNEIAASAKEKHPDKFLTILGYWGTRKPPVKVRPAANLLIIFCAIVECQARPWSHPVNVKRNVRKDLERWIELHPLGGQGIITFEYPTTYYYGGYPYPALYAHAENLRTYKRLGLRGVYICGLGRGHLVHLYSYVMPRLFWNPDQDLGKLIDEFAKAWYGPAWKPMREYVDLLHKAAMASKSENVMDCHAGPGQRFCRELYTRDLLDRAEALFAKAEALADTDLTRRRIQYDKWGILFVDLFLHAGGSGDLVPEDTPLGYRTTLPAAKDYAKVADFLKIHRLFGRSWDIEPRRKYSVAAITGFEPTASPWWSCPRIRRIMEDPEEAARREAQSAGDVVARHVVVLENEHTQAQILPSLGGRIWRLRAKASGEDLLRRNAVPWHLLLSGAKSDAYVDFGGYEEYVGEKFGSPGWAEKYECAVAADRGSATLTTRLPNGLEVRRVVRLLPDRAGVEIDSQVTNRTAQAAEDVVLRAHPLFRFRAGSPGLTLATRKADGGWATRPLQPETWLSGEDLPAGAWGVVAKGAKLALVSEFETSQVGRCFLYAGARGESYNLELFSQKRDLAPGESLRLTHRYVLTAGEWPVQ